MAKKLSWDNMPVAVGKILEILTAEESENTLLPKLIKRLDILERKIEYLQILTDPDKPVMDVAAVCRVLKLKPKAVYALAEAGELPSRKQGNKTVFYEEGVVRYFMTQSAWKAAATQPKPEAADSLSGQSGEPEVSASEGQWIDINAASLILNRKPGAIYQQISTGNLPHYKEGKRLLFKKDELEEWLESHPPRPRKAKA